MVWRVLTGASLSLALISSSFPARAGAAATLDVFPGSGTLAAALAQAQPGDTLRLHSGTFSGAITISTADLTIEPAGDGPVAIDGACTSIAAVTISADGLTLLGPMSVTGGHIYQLDYFGQRSGTVDGMTLLPGACRGSVGIFLQRVGALTVSSTSAKGFDGSGMQILGIADTGDGRLVLRSNDISGGSYGIHVQDVAPGTVQLLGNHVDGATFGGISLFDADGVLVKGNIARNDGAAGISFDDQSDGNRIVRNRAFGSTFDLSNAGSNNCFLRNHYVTSQGDIGC